MKFNLLLLSFIVFLLKSNLYAQNVNFEWVKQIGGDRTENAEDIAIDKSGNIFITGYFYGPVDFDPGVEVNNLKGENDNASIFIAKYNASGQLIWAKNLGNGSGSSITVDAFGDILITGGFSGLVDFDPGPAIYNLEASIAGAFVLKMTNDGDFVWAKHLGENGLAGGSSIATDYAGNIITTGRFDRNADFDPSESIYVLKSKGGGDIFISKLDPFGNFLWAKSFGGPTPDDTHLNSMALDSSGNIYLLGAFFETVDFDPGNGVVNFTSTSEWGNCYLLKLNRLGNFTWAKQLDVSNSEAVTVDMNGNVIFTGNFTNNEDPTGNMVKLTSKGADDVYIIKSDSLGKFIWARQLGGSSNDVSLVINTDREGNIFTGGYFFLTSDLDPGSANYSLTSTGTDPDAFISKLNSAGDFVWAKHFGGNGKEYISSIAIENTGEVYTVGMVHQSAGVFNPAVDTFNLTSTGSDDIFIHKMTQGTVGVDDRKLPDESNIFPNPSKGHFIINMPFEKEPAKVNVRIYTIEGLLLKEYFKTETGKILVDLSDQPQGIYVIKLSSETESFTSKVNVIR